MKKNVILFALAVLTGLAFSGIAAACGVDVGAGASFGLVGVGMAVNAVQSGKVLTLIAPYAVASGAGAQVGSIFGVATATIANGVEGEFETEGVFDLAKTSAQAWTVGQKIYWDNTNKRCDSDGTVGMLIGVATAVAANPSSTGYVKLNEAVPEDSEGPQAAIPDLTFGTNIAAATANGALTDSSATNPSDAQFNELAKELGTKINAILAVMRIRGDIVA